MKKSLFINPKLFKFAAFASATAAPLAIVIACGELSDSQKLVKNVNVSRLSEVRFTGDSRNFNFVVPTELTNVDETDALSPTGQTTGLAVFGRTRLKLGSASDERLNNNSFMPLRLLRAYLRSEVSFSNNGTVLFKDLDGVEKSALTSFNSVYGFNRYNAITANYKGVYDKTSFDLRYQPVNGYVLTPAQLQQVVKPNVSDLQTYVALDESLLSSASLANEAFRGSFKLRVTNNQAENTLTYERDLTLSDLPGDWVNYVDSLGFNTDSLSAPAADFQSLRPVSYSADLASRNLYMRLNAKAGYVLSNTNFDITTVSGVRKMPVLVDRLPEYEALDLSRVSFNALAGVLNINESLVNLPKGTKLEYRLGTSAAWLSATAFSASLAQETSVDFNSVQVHLASTNSDEYVVLNDKLDQPDVTQLNGFVNTRPFFANLNQFNISDSESTAENIVWSGVPTLNADLTRAVSGIEYLIGDFPTAASAAASRNWTKELPKALVSSWSNVNIWIRLNYNANYVANSFIQNITTSSKISLLVNRVDVSALVEQAGAIRALPTSRHSNVLWNSTLTIPSTLSTAVERVEFLSGNFSLEEAQNAEGWSQTLPSRVDYTHARRRLYMRLVPYANVSLNTRIVDLTASSNITNVLSLVDETLLYSSLNLANVELLGSLNQPVVAGLNSALPEGSAYEFSMANQTFSSSSALIDYIKEAKTALSRTDLASLSVKLRVTDRNKFVISNPKSTPVDTANFSLSDQIDTTDLDLAFDQLSVNLTTSTWRNLAWNEQPKIPAALANIITKVEFLSGQFATAREALLSANWSTQLPTAVAFNGAERHLWVRFSVASGYDALSVRDLTRSSQIQKVTSSVDSSAASDLSTIITNNLAPLSSSTHDRVAWAALPDLPKELALAFKISYYSGEYAGPASGVPSWSSVLPRSLLYTHQLRHFWVRITLNEGYTLNDGGNALPLYLDLSSAVQAVRSKVDASLLFDRLDLSAITISGAVAQPVFNNLPDLNSLGLIPGTKLGWRIGNDAWRDQASFIRELRSRAGSLTAADLATIQVSLAVDDETKFVLVDKKITTVGTANLTLLASIEPTVLNSYYQKVAVDLTASSLSNLVWNTSEAPTLEALNAIDKVEFLLGNFATREAALAATQWSTTLPTATSGEPAQRYFWVRYTLKPGYSASNTLFNHSVSSRVREVTSSFSATEVERAFTALETISATDSSLHNAVTWVEPDQAAIAEGLEVQYLSGQYPTLAAASAALDSAWSTSLPNSLNYDHAQRYLWARLKAKPGYSLNSTVTTQLVNLSPSAQAVRSLVDASANYAGLNLSDVVYESPYSDAADASLNLPASINTGRIALPAGTTLNYRLGDSGSWLDLTALLEVIRNSTMTQAEIAAALRIHLVVTDSTKFVLQNDLLSSLTWNARDGVINVSSEYQALWRANSLPARNLRTQVSRASASGGSYDLLVTLPPILTNQALASRNLVLQYSLNGSDVWQNFAAAPLDLPAGNAYAFGAQKAGTYQIFSLAKASDYLSLRVLANRNLQGQLTTVTDPSDWAAIAAETKQVTSERYASGAPLIVDVTEAFNWVYTNRGRLADQLPEDARVGIRHTVFLNNTLYGLNYYDGQLFTFENNVWKPASTVDGLPNPYYRWHDGERVTLDGRDLGPGADYDGLATLNGYLYLLERYTGALYRYEVQTKRWEQRGGNNLGALFNNDSTKPRAYFRGLTTKADNSGFYSMSSDGRLAEYDFASQTWSEASTQSVSAALTVDFSLGQSWAQVVDTPQAVYALEEFTGLLVKFDKATRTWSYAANTLANSSAATVFGLNSPSWTGTDQRVLAIIAAPEGIYALGGARGRVFFFSFATNSWKAAGGGTALAALGDATIESWRRDGAFFSLRLEHNMLYVTNGQGQTVKMALA